MHKVSDRPYWVNNKTSEALWEAYNRVMEGKPNRIKLTDRMTLSSIAVEAGFQRSTLSRKRYPDLAELIEKGAKSKPGQTINSLLQKKREANANLRERLVLQIERYEVLLNRLAALERNHISALQELDRLRALNLTGSVVPFDRKIEGS